MFGFMMQPRRLANLGLSFDCFKQFSNTFLSFQNFRIFSSSSGKLMVSEMRYLSSITSNTLDRFTFVFYKEKLLYYGAMMQAKRDLKEK